MAPPPARRARRGREAGFPSRTPRASGPGRPAGSRELREEKVEQERRAAQPGRAQKRHLARS